MIKGSTNPEMSISLHTVSIATLDYKFEGWLGLDKEAAKGKMVWGKYEPKVWEKRDVDMKVTHCGVCGSDIHTLRSGWAPTLYPCVVGHEIVGTARGLTETYNSRYLNGSKSYGGYANYHRAASHIVFKILDELSSADTAPMLCGGITTYSPLRNNGCGPGKKIGIIGVGGFGHFGILWAKALGADKVVGISRKANKRDDVLKLGADKYIATDEEADWAKGHARSLDLIVCTVSFTKVCKAAQ
ncbi:hypothetical protein BPAE_0060g00020 [Botrytis paeoniae]|uniref:Uncharacterized protein n=1 Tax=Botrytis paeoniae TaxID=278948 RepID=A0A4Z1FX86_9HELO|nr:hypothetical protein BPAE_0060g00020 [Botrytis paeoniae]